MLIIRITNEKQDQQWEHDTGPFELGRGPQREVRRIPVDDQYVSRDQLRIEELSDGRIRVENLSLKNPVMLADGSALGEGANNSLLLPQRLVVGKSQIEVQRQQPAPEVRRGLEQPPSFWDTPRRAARNPASSAASAQLETMDQAAGSEQHDEFQQDLFQTVAAKPAQRPLRSAEVSSGPMAETLSLWLETVLALQSAPAGSPEFFKKTAQAVAELVGLDLGLVLLRAGTSWVIAGSHAVDDQVSVRYSRTLLNHVAEKRQTVYQDINAWKSQAVSLDNIEAVAAAPIQGLNGDVVGVLYGARHKGILQRGGIQPLEAQLVQLLAATVGSNLARSSAMKTRTQFEQFFSAELVGELERNPNLLEGRSQDVTVLFSDLRGFTSLSQRLGAQKTCQMIRDMMERLSARIIDEGGMIVDYAGDGIMAMWNAPKPQEDHAIRACMAALDMIGELDGLNEKWQDQAGGQLALGIGINTGTAQVGNTGSIKKFKYGPHGHTVNLASRVQDATKKLGLPILVTAATRALLPPQLATRRMGRVRLPGVSDPVVLHELYGEGASPEWLSYRDTYESALTQFEKCEWAQSCQTLMPLLRLFEQHRHYDGPTLKLLRRAGECLESRPEPFDGVIEVSTK